MENKILNFLEKNLNKFYSKIDIALELNIDPSLSNFSLILQNLESKGRVYVTQTPATKGGFKKLYSFNKDLEEIKNIIFELDSLRKQTENKYNIEVTALVMLIKEIRKLR